MPTIIHVNRNLISRNRRDGGSRPVYSVKNGKTVVYGHEIRISGGTTIFVDPRSTAPLPCGATIYATTDGEVEILEPVQFQDIAIGTK